MVEFLAAVFNLTHGQVGRPILYGFAALAFACFTTICAAEPGIAEVIHSFDSQINLDVDGTAQVTEKIQMDFQNDERHGILRQIPVTATRKNVPYSIYLKLLSITDENDKPISYRESRDGAEIDFKIGDPAVVLSGKHTYQIKYQVKRAFNWINGRPEFYWNATGDQWRFPMEEASVHLKLPAGLHSQMVSYVSYYGPPGSRKNASGKPDPGGDSINFSQRNLSPGEGLTIAVSMPIGTLHEPTQGDELLWWLGDWWPALLIPFVAFSSLFALWWTGGRDVDSGKAIAVEWNPPRDLAPAEVGTLIDESCDLQDVTSTLVDLAVRGHLKIKELKVEQLFFMNTKDYEFEKTDPPVSASANQDSTLRPFEKLFLAGIFTTLETGKIVRLSDLKGSFYPYLQQTKLSIYDGLMAKKLFRHNPEQTRIVYLFIAATVFFAAIFTCAVSIPSAAGLLVTSIMTGLFARAMPSRTAAGSALTRESLGFARFVKKAESSRIRVLAAEDPTIFGRLLPYAMALGAADQWALAFKDLAIQPPDWYVSSNGYDTFSSSIFINDLGSSIRSIEHTFTTPAQSSSSNASSAWSGGSAFDGGGSGGGFGGGGGSSW